MTRGKRVLAPQSEADVSRQLTAQGTQQKKGVAFSYLEHNVVLDHGTASNYILRRQMRDDKHSNKKEGNFRKNWWQKRKGFSSLPDDITSFLIN